jgi:hypothetical protein
MVARRRSTSALSPGTVSRFFKTRGISLSTASFTNPFQILRDAGPGPRAFGAGPGILRPRWMHSGVAAVAYPNLRVSLSRDAFVPVLNFTQHFQPAAGVCLRKVHMNLRRVLQYLEVLVPIRFGAGGARGSLTSTVGAYVSNKSSEFH